MVHKIFYWTILGLSAGLVVGCGGDGHPNAAEPPVPIPQMIDTAQVLSLAQATSETSTPFTVDGGLVTFSDTSETSAPISINAM
jgi:hypothetical protein